MFFFLGQLALLDRRNSSYWDFFRSMFQGLYASPALTLYLSCPRRTILNSDWTLQCIYLPQNTHLSRISELYPYPFYVLYNYSVDNK